MPAPQLRSVLMLAPVQVSAAGTDGVGTGRSAVTTVPRVALPSTAAARRAASTRSRRLVSPPRPPSAASNPPPSSRHEDGETAVPVVSATADVLASACLMTLVRDSQTT